jgi:hypothetical protein
MRSAEPLAIWTPITVSNHLTFDDWIESRFPGQPSLHDPELDIDFDGLASLAEFGLGSLPGVPDDPPADPFGELAGDRMCIDFERDLNRVGLAIIAEASDDFVSWLEIARSEQSQPFTGTATVVETPSGAGRSRVRIEDTITTEEAAAGRFARIRFSLMGAP